MRLPDHHRSKEARKQGSKEASHVIASLVPQRQSGSLRPGTLDQVAQQSRSIAEQLDAAPELPVPVVWRPVLTEPDAISRVMLDGNADDDCVGVVVWMHTFSPAKMWIGGFTALAKPLLHLHTQFDVDLPYAELDMDFMNLNQAAHGDREIGYIQTRVGLARKTVAGHVTDPRVRNRIATWQRAAIGARAIRTLKLARFGDNMRQVAVTEGDKVDAQIRFGVSVNTYGCELAIYMAASLHAKWPSFRTAVRVKGARTAGRPDKSPIAAR